ncbi:hypothetical protein MC45_15880 [Sphingomonas taxi]|uniref:Uncharacterized protein n=2 Tax=Sphingomonas taxi TaxID=1549858 RepID=A0A097EJ63_9SPHN|nr:hypothetical protein MC45_15880 [Sphingomonas taxi]
MAEDGWSDEEFALQSMEGPAPALDASDFVRAVRLQSAPAEVATFPRVPPPPGWAPPRAPFDRYAIDCQPDDPNDVAGWARWLRALDERGSTSYRKFCWRHGEDRKMRRVLLRLATSRGLPAGLCAAMGLIPLRQQCGAWARQAGRPCRNYAGPNGRCRFHGGRSRPPRGNKNGQKHGRYSIEARRARYAEKQQEGHQPRQPEPL